MAMLEQSMECSTTNAQNKASSGCIELPASTKAGELIHSLDHFPPESLCSFQPFPTRKPDWENLRNCFEQALL